MKRERLSQPVTQSGKHESTIFDIFIGIFIKIFSKIFNTFMEISTEIFIANSTTQLSLKMKEVKHESTLFRMILIETYNVIH